jgi:hypothetical protein
MSIIQSNGKSVFQATKIINETYENLSILFSELDRVGEQEGYVTITPRFMRYKSDTDFNGWMTINFIKLYVKSDIPPTSIEDIRELPWFGVMVDLEGNEEEGIPMLSILRYQYDQTFWDRLPTVSDHWAFWAPFVEDGFDVIREGNEWTSTSSERAKKKHYGFEKAKAIDIPLFEVNSPEDIRVKVFKGLDQLIF